jgi:hypothetical protein
LFAATLSLAASTACKAPVKPREVELLAASTLDDLTSGNVTRACSRIYEPPDWDADRIAVDHRDISTSVAAVMKELGTLSDARPIHSWSMYELQITGATVQYWQALPNLGIATRVTYAVTFSNIGPGILSFSFTHLSGNWELRSISFGVEPSVPDARQKAVRIGRTLLKSQAPPGMSDEQLDQFAERAITPMHN